MNSQVPGPHRPWIIWVLAAVIGILLVAFVLVPRVGNNGQNAEKPQDHLIPIAECRSLLQARNLGLGYLENENFAKAEPYLRDLAEKLQRDPVGVRNFAILKLLTLDAKHDSAEQLRQAFDAATLAAQQLLQIEPDSYVSHLLAGRVEFEAVAKLTDLKPDDQLARTREGVKELQQAAKLAPRDPAILWTLFDKGRYVDDEEVRAAARQALREAYAIDPRNLFILTEWLRAQADARDPEIIATLKAAKETLVPIQEGVKKRARVDVIELVDQALAAAEKPDWPTTLGLVLRLNVIRSEDMAQSDRRRLDRHPLEYVVQRFGPEFCNVEDLQRADADPEIPVKLVKEAATSIGGLREVHDVVAADFDLDTRTDLAVLETGALTLYRRTPESGEWQKFARFEPIEGAEHLLAADLDRDVHLPAKGPAPAKPETVGCQDADPDVVLFGSGGIRVLRNEVSGTNPRQREFQVVEQSEEFRQLKDVSAAALADLDHDGDLDLVVCAGGRVQFWGNRGDLTFENVSADSQFPSPDIEFTTIIPVDWDRDVDIDFVLTGPRCDEPGLLENLRHRQFRWQPFGDDYANLRRASSVALADVDGNAAWDLIAASDKGIFLIQTQNPAPGHVMVLAVSGVSRDATEHVLAWDFDNDGRTDILGWGGPELRALRGLGDGRFNPSPKLFESPHGSVLACEAADLDGDGDLDLALGTAGALDFLSNEGGNKNHWIDVRARGDADTKVPHVNQYGFGSLLEVRAGDLYQAQVIGRQLLHFGLGKRDQADSVRVLWTNGVPQDTVQAKVNETICERQALKGSCPYVYTWTGEKYEFFTDLLWAAPIGLQFADGVMAPSRPWEFIKVPGDRLKARDGRVQMSVTEELWEATYFDQIELIAVDHPADVEIYSNEKVGPADLAEFKVHTVREKRLPVAARDQRGRDRMDEIRAEDGVFVRAFDRRECLGFAEPHYLELDLGRLDEVVASGDAGPHKITLFLTGWIYPTDVSTNIALSQRGELGHPKPPSLWTPDESGQWREVRPYMGFPGGKTKTIAVDLTGVFAPGDYRLRIQTTQELYWDAAFFTVDEQPADVKLTHLAPQAVDLHYRGFSEPFPKRPNAPEIYDYAQVRTAPKWPPMAGKFTRYGNVTELLAATDDKLVVIAAGDEL
ncbi:MAG TPA: FG-GAP-like repeat-containing protein, partial [Planctomycetaceae bacterium]|nr:FG-GAP-like repeat-containing protein [Planctomycetaceae bacterium]